MRNAGRLRAWLAERLELGDHNARIPALEGLRGLAVLLTFLQHHLMRVMMLADGPADSFTADVKGYGNLGVELFFVLSGYFVYGMLLRNATPFPGFLRRRAVRVYPAFLAVLALSVAVQNEKIPADGAFLYLIANLLLLPGLFPIQPQVRVAWSLSYEALFYLLAPLLTAVFALRRRDRATRVAIVSLLAVAFSVATQELPWFPGRMAGFFVGILLAEGVGRSIPVRLGLAAPLVAFLVDPTAQRLPPLAAEWMHVLALGALCAACLRDGGLASRVFSWTPLRRLGNISYSYYLTNGFVTSLVYAMLARSVGTVSFAVGWALLPAVFLLSLVPALLLFLLVERPLSLPRRRRLAGPPPVVA